MRIPIAILLLVATPALAQPQSAFQACMEAEVYGSKYNALRAKLGLVSARDATFAMLSDKTTPTDEEQPEIAAWADLRARCLQHDAPFRRQLAPDAAALIESYEDGLLTLASRLYTRDVTYAEFNRSRSELTQRLNAALGNIRQRDQARAVAADEADYQQRRAVALQYLLGRQPAYAPPTTVAPYQIPTPSTTACHRFGNQLTCTTR